MNTQVLLVSLVTHNLIFTNIQPPNHLTIVPPSPTQLNQQNQVSIFRIKSFVFQGNTVLSNEELQKILTSFIGKEVSFSDLQEITNVVTDYYVKKGYINSGAYLPVAQNQSLQADGAVVTIGILEGQIEQIEIIATDKTVRTYTQKVKEKLNTFDAKTL